MTENQIILRITNKLLNGYMKKEHQFEGVLKLDAYQFITNRKNSYFNHHNIEIIRIKVKKSMSIDEINKLKKSLKTSLNLILRVIEGANHKNVLHIKVKVYSSCDHQKEPSLFPN